MINLSGKKYSVLGAGRSGIGIAKLLKKFNASVFLSDSSPKEKLLYFDESVLTENNIEFELGTNSDRVLEAEVLVVSPGIPPSAGIIVKAKSKNIQVLSEIEVSYGLCNAPIIAITGTNGKTTTTELTGALLREAGYDVHVCGNVGIAFSEVIPLLKENSIVVLETSSFQLENIFEFRPRVSMILNITSDHLDWHGGFDNYAAAKFSINRNQEGDDLLIINYNDKILRNKTGDFNAGVAAFSEEKINDGRIKFTCYIKDGAIYYNGVTEEKIIDRNDVLLKGMHNAMNSMAAIIAAKKFDVENDVIRKVLREFSGVEHRIEFVRSLNGVDYYNDSKATNYDSLFVALESFKNSIILIMGGKKGDNNFSLVEDMIKERVKMICAIGQSGDVIYGHFKDYKEVKKFESLESAVEYSKSVAVSGDHVLFSPGYKSFDMFNNFEHRGEIFKQIVKNLI